MNLPTETTIEKIVEYLGNQGIVVDYNDLHNHLVNTSTKQNNPQKKKKTFKVTKKNTNTSKLPQNTNEKKKIKFKPKKNKTIIKNLLIFVTTTTYTTFNLMMNIIGRVQVLRLI